MKKHFLTEGTAWWAMPLSLGSFAAGAHSCPLPRPVPAASFPPSISGGLPLRAARFLGKASCCGHGFAPQGGSRVQRGMPCVGGWSLSHQLLTSKTRGPCVLQPGVSQSHKKVTPTSPPRGCSGPETGRQAEVFPTRPRDHPELAGDELRPWGWLMDDLTENSKTFFKSVFQQNG